MILNSQTLQDLYKRYNDMTNDELAKEFDELTSKIQNFKVTLNPEESDVLKKFMDTVPLNPGFGYCSAGIVLYDKLSSTVSGGKLDSSELNIVDIRTFQKFLVDSKPTNVSQMRAVSAALLSTNGLNTEIGALEETQRVLSQIITQKENEAATGLQYSAENANAEAALRGEDTQVIREDVHVTENVDSKSNAKANKKAIAKNANAK